MRVLLGSVVLAVTPILRSQELWHVDDVLGQSRQGYRIVRMGDVNHDGWDDIVEIADGVHGLGGLLRNEIWILSGFDGSLISAYPAPRVLDSFGNVLSEQVFVVESLASVGDIDIDSVPDYAVTGFDYVLGQPQNPVLQVRSGFDHHLIWSVSIPGGQSADFGHSIAGGLDLNGDGRLDLVTSATGLSPGGAVIAYDNAGVELYRFVNPNLSFVVGVDLAGLRGDLNGDGSDDYLSGSPYGQDQGAVILMSGSSGVFLRTSFGTQPLDKLSEVTGCGDIDGDGVLDYAGGGMWGASVVTTFSGATGLPIHSYRPGIASEVGFGFHLASGFDCDQDGINDLVASSAFSGWGHQMSGRDGTLIGTLGSSWTLLGDESASELTLLGPPPGEQYPMIVYYTATRQSPVYSRVVARRLIPVGVSSYGAPDATAAAPLAIMGMRDLPGPQIRFTLASAPPGAFTAFVVGYSSTSIGSAPLPLPLDPIGLGGITLLTSMDLSWTGWAGTAGLAAGYVGLDAYATLGTTGAPLFAQWLWIDPLDWSRNGSTAAHSFSIR